MIFIEGLYPWSPSAVPAVGVAAGGVDALAVGVADADVGSGLAWP
jgi:hypothetical protein